MKLGFVFPGQGCQWVGMGKDLFTQFPEARAVFDAADDALGEKLSHLCFEGPEETLKLTANTQPAVLTVSIAAWAVFSKRAMAPLCAAGHSLGEYSALVATGSLPLGAAVRAVRERGRFMQEAVPAGVGAMAAVLGLPADQVGQVCARLAQGRVLSPANYNSPEQTVIAGHADAVEGAAKPMQEAGAKRVIPLQVSAPFHCALMEPVKPLLKEILKAAAFAPPRSPVVTNVEAKPNSDPNRTLPLLLEQVSQPVRWVECVEEMRRQGVTHFVELGPGKVLRGLIKQISKDTPVFGVEDAQGLEKALAGVSGG
jgi:[acyl-carrier-protein] S-malonyltransferase